LLWRAATTGARRGELCALRWSNVDLDAGELLIVRNLIVHGGQLLEKETKTHAARRIALFNDSIALLDEHWRRCVQRAQPCGVTLTPDAYVFSFDPAGRQPMNPESVTHRFGRLAKQLGLRARLHDLRHYAATQLIAGGVDVRTVSGRIGHAGGGATTLRCTRSSSRRPTDVRPNSSNRRSGDRIDATWSVFSTFGRIVGRCPVGVRFCYHTTMDSSAEDPTAAALAWLRSSDEPAVRYLTRRDLLDDRDGAAWAVDAAQILEGRGPRPGRCWPASSPTAASESILIGSGPGPTGGWCRWWNWLPQPGSRACRPPPRPCWTG
jgi:hypothetical protein